jgi:O-antigen ligase
MNSIARAPSPGAAAKAALILCSFALFATENLVHYPVALMSLIGLAQIVSRPRDCLAGQSRTLIILFCLIWLPMLIASIDAFEFERAAETTALYFHFLPAAFFVLGACRDRDVLRLVTAGTAILVIFVGFDAFAQLIWRVDLFGYPYDDEILRGVFYPKQRLGLFLAAFAPLYVDAVIRWCRYQPRLWFLLVPLVIVILMTLKRSAWVMLFVGMAGYLALYVRINRKRVRDLPILPVTIIVVIAVITVSINPALEQRVKSTAGVFSADQAVVEEATAYRLPLWRTGAAILAENWITGIGPRGFRHAYAIYADDADFWLQRKAAGQTHPHLLILEVAIESGLLGVAGLIGVYVLLGRELLRARPPPELPVWLLCCFVAWFPLNVHLAFYGSYWSTFAWLLIPLGLASVDTERVEAPAAPDT